MLNIIYIYIYIYIYEAWMKLKIYYMDADVPQVRSCNFRTQHHRFTGEPLSTTGNALERILSSWNVN